MSKERDKSTPATPERSRATLAPEPKRTRVPSFSLKLNPFSPKKNKKDGADGTGIKL